MSKHRIKSIAVEDDFGDDYEVDEEHSYSQSGYAEEEEVSAEDQEKLRVGTVQVRSGLDQGFAFITDEEIQDTLWHYYYDIPKSVNYLRTKHAPSQSRREKTRPDKATTQLPIPLVHEASIPINISHPLPPTAKDFFYDCPWLQIPPNRRAEIVIEPIFPRLGLLGGSSAGDGKMSKIAALAAKRRQKNENQKASTANIESSVENSASSMSRLRVSTKDIPETPAKGPLQPRQKLEPKTRPEQTQDPPSLEEASSSPTKSGKDEKADETFKPDHVQSAGDVADLRATPSMFARTLMDFRDSTLTFPPRPSTSLPDPVISSFDFSRPSPDEVVLRAQNSKGSKPPAAVKQQKPTRPKESVIGNMKDLSLTEPTKIKRKNLDVLAEYRKVKWKNAANFVVIGHVDAGKSTLMGRLLFDLGAVDERTVEKYRKEAEKMGKGSFALAWILDQGTEERARGVTMDIATNKFETDRTSFTILDAPGHRDFVPNMIAGASQADFAVLVIDSSTGEFESGLKGQTKEHTLVVRSMGVSKIVVVVNKMDRTDWSEERFRDIQQQMLAFLTTAGFKRESVSFVPCSGLLGDNILHKTTNPRADWYCGKTLVEELDACEPTNRALDKPLRMTVGDVFYGSLPGLLSMSGRIEAGSLQVGDQIMVMPSGEKASIRSIQVDDKSSDWAVAGQNVVLHVPEIDPAQIRVGDMLCNPASGVSNVSSFTAKVLAFGHLTPMPLEVHRGRLHVAGKISSLVALLDKADGSIIKPKPKIVQPGTIARVVVELDSPAPIEGGRIVLRANGETVAAGLLE